MLTQSPAHFFYRCVRTRVPTDTNLTTGCITSSLSTKHKAGAEARSHHVPSFLGERAYSRRLVTSARGATIQTFHCVRRGGGGGARGACALQRRGGARQKFRRGLLQLLPPRLLTDLSADVSGSSASEARPTPLRRFLPESLYTTAARIITISCTQSADSLRSADGDHGQARERADSDGSA